MNDVVNCDIEELIETIKVAGMPMKKAKTIKEVTDYIVNNLDGDIYNIKGNNINETREN